MSVACLADLSLLYARCRIRKVGVILHTSYKSNYHLDEGSDLCIPLHRSVATKINRNARQVFMESALPTHSNVCLCRSSNVNEQKRYATGKSLNQFRTKSLKPLPSKSNASTLSPQTGQNLRTVRAKPDHHPASPSPYAESPKARRPIPSCTQLEMGLGRLWIISFPSERGHSLRLSP